MKQTYSAFCWLDKTKNEGGLNVYLYDLNHLFQNRTEAWRSPVHLSTTTTVHVFSCLMTLSLKSVYPRCCNSRVWAIFISSVTNSHLKSYDSSLRRLHIDRQSYLFEGRWYLSIVTVIHLNKTNFEQNKISLWVCK